MTCSMRTRRGVKTTTMVMMTVTLSLVRERRERDVCVTGIAACVFESWSEERKKRSYTSCGSVGLLTLNGEICDRERIEKEREKESEVR